MLKYVDGYNIQGMVKLHGMRSQEKKWNEEGETEYGSIIIRRDIYNMGELGQHEGGTVG